MGQSLQVILPIVPTNLPDELWGQPEAIQASKVKMLENCVVEARNNLLMAKVSQAHLVNTSRGHEDVYIVGNWVMLSTLH